MQKETLFEKELKKSVKTFNRVYGQELTEKILIQFFPDKHPVHVDELRIKPDVKNAIILLGLSSCGKTTYGKEFCEHNPTFTFVSMDECGIRDLEPMSEHQRNEYLENPDLHYQLGNNRFGRMLAKANAKGKSMVIDGNWIHMNARGALLKTLEQYGYYTTIMSMLKIPEPIYESRKHKRVLNRVSKNIMNISSLDYYDKDYVQVFAEKNDIPYFTAKKMIESIPFFSLEEYMFSIEIETEKSDANYFGQLLNSLLPFEFGADAFFDVYS